MSIRHMRIFQLCNALGVFREGHFEFSSGLHSNVYIDKEIIFENDWLFSYLCLELALLLTEGGSVANGALPSRLGTSASAVIGPAEGGAKVAKRVAQLLGQLTGYTVLGIAAEKQNGSFCLQASDLEGLRGKNVVVAEDTLTTGSSAQKVIELLTRNGANVFCLVSWFCRMPASELRVGARVMTLCETPFSQWWPTELHAKRCKLVCPECLKKVPLERTSHQDPAR